MAAVISAQNSTNVRTHIDVLRTPRRVVRALSWIAPDAAAAYAERLFLSVPRHPRPLWEAEILASAERDEVIIDDTAVPTWRWGAHGGGGGAGDPTVLLVHGWSGRGSQLGAFVAPLVDAGFRVVTFDGPGHGDAKARLGSVVTQARATAGMVAHLGGVSAIVAHSVGAASSTLAASWAPLSIGRFVLLAPPVSPAKYLDQFGRMLALSTPVQVAMRRRVEERYGITVDRLDASEAASKLTAPALVIHDTDDREVPLTDGVTIANAWPGATFHATSGLGHRRILRDRSVVDDVVRFVTSAPARFTATDERAALERSLFTRQRSGRV